MTERCQERVWDNGDMTDCGHVMPCTVTSHSPEQVAARKALEKIHTLMMKPYAAHEHYLDRLQFIARIVTEATLTVPETGGEP